jgi:hypothetical protein
MTKLLDWLRDDAARPMKDVVAPAEISAETVILGDSYSASMDMMDVKEFHSLIPR